MKTMTDQLEQNLREALSYRDAQLDPAAITRLRAIDYRPRRRPVRRLPALGVLGVGGLAASAGVVVALSGAAPAFAGWQSKPTAAAASRHARAHKNCGQGLGASVLSESRGPYTASIYAESTTSAICLSGNGITMSSRSTSSSSPTIASDGVQFGGGGMRDTAGDALTLSDGRVGSGVTGVTIDLSDGTSVQATVSNGWYLAWWPGDASATQALIATASGTNTVTYPAAPAPSCPSGGNCSYGFSEAGKSQAANQSSQSSGTFSGGSPSK